MCTNAKSSAQLFDSKTSVYIYIYIYIYTKKKCNFVVTFWLTIFTYGQTFGVFVQILSDD